MRPAKRELRRERIMAARDRLAAYLAAEPDHPSAAGWRRRIAEYETALEAEALEARAAKLRARGRKSAVVQPGAAALHAGGE